MVRGLERSGSVTKPQRSLTQVVTDAEEIVDLAEAPRFTAPRLVPGRPHAA
jgi:hypothetical protein